MQKKQEFEQRQRDGEVNTQNLEVVPRAAKSSKDGKEVEEKLTKQQKSKVSIIIMIIDHFYIALFSAFKQTHCAHMWFYVSE